MDWSFWALLRCSSLLRRDDKPNVWCSRIVAYWLIKVLVFRICQFLMEWINLSMRLPNCSTTVIPNFSTKLSSQIFLRNEAIILNSSAQLSFQIFPRSCHPKSFHEAVIPTQEGTRIWKGQTLLKTFGSFNADTGHNFIGPHRQFPTFIYTELNFLWCGHDKYLAKLSSQIFLRSVIQIFLRSCHPDAGGNWNFGTGKIAFKDVGNIFNTKQLWSILDPLLNYANAKPTP